MDGSVEFGLGVVERHGRAGRLLRLQKGEYVFTNAPSFGMVSITTPSVTVIHLNQLHLYCPYTVKKSNVTLIVTPAYTFIKWS